MILIVLICMVSINSVISCIYGVNYGVIKPEVATIQVGQNLEFICELESKYVDTGELSVSNVYFTHQNETFAYNDVQILDKYKVQLKITNASLKANGNYYCYVRKGSERKIVCVSEAHVGFKPLSTQDFNCIYYYREKMECTWSIPNNPIHTNYTLFEYTHGMKDYERSCGLLEIDENSQSSKCIWTHQTIPILRYQNVYYFIMYSANQLGKKEQSFSLTLSSIVKTSPPQEFYFYDNTLHWKHPKKIIHDSHLKNSLQYRIDIIENDNIIQTIDYFNEFNYTHSYQVQDLKPYTNYSFTISCKVNDSINENWSDKLLISNITNAAVPSTPPHLIDQSFETNKIHNLNRSITIYWRETPEENRNGPNFQYVITYFKMYNHSKFDYVENITTTYTNATFNIHTKFPYKFKIYSLNILGKSLNFSKIIIPSNDDILPPPRKISVFLLNQNRYKVKWLNSQLNVKDYTLFWCKSKHNHCFNRIDWKNTTKNEAYIENLDDDNYMFGVSSNTQYSTSGISWSKCFANMKSQIVDKLDHVWVVKKNSSSILIRWEFICEAQKALINDFQIEYCPVSNKTYQSCTDIEYIQTINSKDEYWITNLEPYTLYKISVSSTKIREKRQPLLVKTDLGIPSSPSNLSVINLQKHFVTIQWMFTNENNIVQHFKVEFSDKQSNVLLDACDNFICLYNITFHRNLNAFSDCTVYVSACNDLHCSNKSQVLFKTMPSNPGKMDIPAVIPMNSSTLRIHFKNPLEPNGPIDYYHIKVQDIKNKTQLYKYFANATFADVHVEDCGKYSLQDDRKFYISISASNLINKKEFQGDFSDLISIPMPCKIYSKTIYIVLAIIFFCIIISFIIYFCISCISEIKKNNNKFNIPVKCQDRNEIETFNNPELEMNKIEFSLNENKISTSVTNNSMISESSSGENSHSTDKYLSSSDNFYSSDSGVKGNNSRQNREYYFYQSDTISFDDSCRPFLEKKPKPYITKTTMETFEQTVSDNGLESSKMPIIPASILHNGYVPLSAVTNFSSQYDDKSTSNSISKV